MPPTLNVLTFEIFNFSGGIYKATKPEHEETTKAHQTMSPAKKMVLFKGTSE